MEIGDRSIYSRESKVSPHPKSLSLRDRDFNSGSLLPEEQNSGSLLPEGEGLGMRAIGLCFDRYQISDIIGA